MTWQVAFQLALSGVGLGGIYAMVALALVIPYKASGVLNFAQGEIVTFGAYTGLVLSLTLALPFALVVSITLVTAALIGFAIERLLIRPIARAPEFTLVIATFAVGLIIRAVIRLHWQDNTFPFDAPYVGPPLAVGPLRLNPAYLVIILCLAAVVVVLAMFFSASKYGKAMRAVALDSTAARLMGIGINSIFGSAWAIATAIGALAGLLLAPIIGVNPEIGHLILKALVAAVIGGFTSLGGAVIGGVLLGLLESFSGAMLGASFKNILPFIVLILLLLWKPHGLFGRALQKRV